MYSAGIHPIGVYTNSRQTNISDRVSFRTIYALCMEEDNMLGMIRMVRWWYQDAINEPEK